MKKLFNRKYYKVIELIESRIEEERKEARKIKDQLDKENDPEIIEILNNSRRGHLNAWSTLEKLLKDIKNI